MPTIESKIDNYIRRSFRDVADDDYVAARVLYRDGLHLQFLWSALQALEKYLKAILLYRRVAIKGLAHNLANALIRVRAVESLAFEIPDDVDKFIRRLAVQGINRYFEHPLTTEDLGLLELDKAVWHVRKYCRSQREGENSDNPIDGRIEEIQSQRTRARQDLIWKNLYFGRYRKIKFSRRVNLAWPSNAIFPEIFPELDKLIHFSKPVREHFLHLSK